MLENKIKSQNTLIVHTTIHQQSLSRTMARNWLSKTYRAFLIKRVKAAAEKTVNGFADTKIQKNTE